MNELNYEAPEVEVVEVAVEQGFAATDPAEDHAEDKIVPPGYDDDGL